MAMNLCRLILPVAFSLAFSFLSLAQTEPESSTQHIQKADSTGSETQQPEKKQRLHSPKLATLLSAVMPGAGQIYNRKYWKLPIVYGAMGGLIYSAIWNNTERNIYRDAYLLRVDEDSLTIDQFAGQYTDDNLLSLQSTYKRNRDISFIFLGVVYVLNIVDAAVDAHLFYFDVSENLSINWQPTMCPTIYNEQPNVGLAVTLTLR